MSRRAGLAAITVAVLLFVAGAVALHGAHRFGRVGPLESDTVVYVPRGSGLDEVTRRLNEAGVVQEPLIFRLCVRFLGVARRLQAGEYLFPAGVSMRGVVDLMVSGGTVVRRLTVPEGLTSVETVALVQAAEGLDGEVGPVPPEGTLLPETYHYARGDARAELLARMRAAREAVLDELWSGRDPAVPLATAEQAVTLASIVEKETGVPEERSLVASVFLNRLKKGMRLQSDPTVVYGLTGGAGPLGRDLTRADLQAPSRYNTYLIKGLPPGPIANPGRASITAVLHPAPSRYLYFVADGSGGHAFAETLDEHNRNVAKWRKLRRQGQ